MENNKKEATVEKLNLTEFIWKGPKEKIGTEIIQTSMRLVDASYEQLLSFHKYCDVMLNNTDKDKPGRKPLLGIIADQRQRCNAQLFLRWMNQECQISSIRLLESIRNFKDRNRDIIEKMSELESQDITEGLPIEFIGIPVSLIEDACLERLGRFNKQHITLSFIIKQGLWFTQQEIKELNIKDENGETVDRLKTVSDLLGLKPDIKLHISPRGLTYAQFRAMIQLKSKKYSELTSEQLKTLRDRILFSLEENVRFHIVQWEQRKHQIEVVAESKRWEL